MVFLKLKSSSNIQNGDQYIVGLRTRHEPVFSGSNSAFEMRCCIDEIGNLSCNHELYVGGKQICKTTKFRISMSYQR